MDKGQKDSTSKEMKKRKDEGLDEEGGTGRRVCRFPLLVAVLQLLLGAAVATVAFLTLAVSPSLTARETPHWAGILLCLVSLLGFLLYCITSRPDERSSLQFICKISYFILCTVGLVLSLLAAVFAGYHHSQTSSLTCVRVQESCRCKLQPDDPIARLFTYQEVDDCEAATGTLALYFLIQIVLNAAQALVCAVAAFIMWKNRYQVFFAGLQIGSPSPQLWQKV